MRGTPALIHDHQSSPRQLPGGAMSSYNGGMDDTGTSHTTFDAESSTLHTIALSALTTRETMAFLARTMAYWVVLGLLAVRVNGVLSGQSIAQMLGWSLAAWFIIGRNERKPRP